jgi:hypothetical protein
MSPGMILIAILAATGPVTYGYMKVREIIVVKAAVKAERNAGVMACNARVAQIETANKTAVTKAVEEATRAEALVPDTPEGAELVKLCNASASCRSRGKL